MLSLPKLILASGSPRRAEILTSVGWEFTKDSADIDETELTGELPEDYVQRLAKEKAETVAQKYTDAIILGADTTVVIDDQIIGKPVDLADAKRMLKMLAGNWHEVLTGVAIVEVSSLRSQIPSLKSVAGIQRTRVKFAEMSKNEIEFLAEKGEPLDKAGAYAVQAQAALFIEKIEGDYWNVVGLPVSLVYGLIQDLSGHG
ncbi:MAG TPA: Maf family protein [Pyrinomonadaceae bacterium]|nr:Maf family protein [Pyrinomonadaceae bacterium]